MRKVFIVALALLMALVGMSAAAEGSTYKSLTPNNGPVLFENGFTGYCIDNHLKGTQVGKEFQEAGTNQAISNYAEYDSAVIEQYLKALIVNYHDDFFPQNGTGGYHDSSSSSPSGEVFLSQAIWMFSDEPYKLIDEDTTEQDFVDYGISKAIGHSRRLCEIIDGVKASVNTKMIPDVVIGHKLSSGDYADFEFKVMKSNDPEIQDFFAFRIVYHRTIEVDPNEEGEYDEIDLNAAISSNSQIVKYTWVSAGKDGVYDNLIDDTDGVHTFTFSGDEDLLYRCTVENMNKKWGDDTVRYPFYKTDYYFTVKINGLEQNEVPSVVPASDQDVYFTADDGAINLIVSATDADTDDTLTFTWYEYFENNSPVEVEGAATDGNTSMLTLDPNEENYDGRVFYCAVSDGTDTVQSKKFTLKEVTVQWKDGNTATVNVGDDVPLTVVAQNATKYEWYSVDSESGRTLLGETTTPTYAINDVTLADNGNRYVCVAVNLPEGGTRKAVETTEFTLSVVTKCVPAKIQDLTANGTKVENEGSYTAADGAAVKLCVSATGTDLTYQWSVKNPGEENFTDIDDATEAEYDLGAVSATKDNGRVFRCTVKNDCGVDTREFTLNVLAKCVPPVITSPEKDDTYTAADNTNVKLCVTATGTDLTYQWSVKNPGEEDFTEIEGATEAEYDLGAVTTEDNGKIYRCTVKNGCGEASRDFTLSVAGKCVPAKIQDLTANGTKVENEGSYTAADGAAVKLCVSATGTDLTYQWSVKNPGEENFTDIDDATEAEYDLGAVSATKDNGRVFRCTVKNDCGVDTREFTLNVLAKCVPPVITSPEKDDTYTAADNTNVKLCVTATGTDLTYQWSVKNPGEEDFTEIEGATEAEYDLGAVTTEDNGKIYRCTVKNGCGEASRDFTLEVSAQDDDTPPEFVHPKDEMEVPFSAGEDVVLTMPSEDHEFVRFAWYALGSDGEPELLDGHEGDTFKIEDCASEHNGTSLVCVAEDADGNTYSLKFVLVMKPDGKPPVITSPTSDADISACEGQKVTLTITAENADTYQWYVDKDGDNMMEGIEGATGTSYTIPSVTKEMSGYVYACVAFNEFGFAGSPVFKIGVEDIPKMPATGDGSMPLAWLSMLLVSAGACVYLMRRRQAE